MAPSAAAATSTLPSAEQAKNESFVRFQQALQMHNAARNGNAHGDTNGHSNANGPSTSSTHSTSTSASASASASSSKPSALASLEEVARKHAQSSSSSLLPASHSKPVYLTKAQRQEAALKRLEEQRTAAERAAREKEENMKAFMQGQTNNNHHQAERDARAAAARAATEARDRQRGSDAGQRMDVSNGMDGGRQRELELIRQQYLGQKDPSAKKKQQAPSNQRFKFNFGWNAKDDTAVDTNDLYKERHQAAALYGRGFVGGVDRKEQRKKHTFYEELAEYRLKHPEAVTTLAAGVESNKGVEPMDMSETGHVGPVDVSVPIPLSELRDSVKAAERAERDARKAREAELRNRHWREKKLDEMEERDWRIFKEDFAIATRGPKVPHPLRSWEEANLPSQLMRALEQAGYKEPTPIQRAAIPIGLQNRDLIGLAETGSGKTVAFLIPMLVYISQQPTITAANASEGPYALIMAPTRELAQQISAECDKFSAYMGIRNVCVVGGMAIEEQGFQLREGAHAVIGTPGRLFDCVQKRYLALNQCNYIVLDEADRMIDIGFEAQILQVMDQMPTSALRPESAEEEEAERARVGEAAVEGRTIRYRQTVFFSATMPPRVEALTKKYLRHPVIISVGDRAKAAALVEQRVEWMTSEGAKKNKLLELVQHSEPPIIIFTNLKKNCESICRWLSGVGVSSVSLHGSKGQEDRMAALATFKAGEADALVATDVAGRGLDVHGVTHVINYDLPGDIEKYTHRIGRTGRAGKAGLATSFVMESDSDIFYDLVQILRASNQHVPPQLAHHEAAKFAPGTIHEGGKPKPKIQYAK